eukprot:2658488-Alexandrium_andersonii.AAC.1
MLSRPRSFRAGHPRELGLGRAPAALSLTRFAPRLLAPLEYLGRVAFRGARRRETSATWRG